MTNAVTKKIGQILNSEDPVKEIITLHEREELDVLFPELEESWGFDQRSKYHNLSLTDHTLAVLDKVVKAGGSFTVRLAALLHDVAKYKCYQAKADGTYSFIGHDRESAKLAKKILYRCGFSKEVVWPVVFLIKNHMIIKNYGNPYNGKDEKTRFIARRLGDLFDDEMTLIDADNCSHAPEYCMPGQVESFKKRLSGIKMAKYRLSTPEEVAQEFNLKDPTAKSVRLIIELLDSFQDSDPDISKEEAFDKIHKGNRVNKILKSCIKQDQSCQ